MPHALVPRSLRRMVIWLHVGVVVFGDCVLVGAGTDVRRLICVSRRTETVSRRSGSLGRRSFGPTSAASRSRNCAHCIEGR